MSTPDIRPQPTRVDLPLSNSLSNVAHTDIALDRGSNERASSTSLNVSVQMDKPRTNSKTKPASLRFFVVDDPKQLKDKAQLKANRRHVMHDYLDKERQNPYSADIRITKAARKRKRSSVESSSNPAAPSSIFEEQKQSSAFMRPKRSPPMLSTEDSVVSTPSPEAVLSKPVKFVDDVSPLVRGIAGGFDNSRYLRASPESIPGPIAQAYLGSNLQPFACWPILKDPTLCVEQLKWSCSRHFGSYGISRHWVPELLKAKHAFLSTICISASHDDIMMRGQQAPHERKPYGSTDRLKVRSEVLGLINQALADPAMQTTDATLISVLHVLNSEIMGCDDRIMRIHQHGLDDLVKERGGLGKLGIDGQLASILTITMFLISALRETEPDPTYARYARQHRAVSHNPSRQIPESPLYVRPSGYETIKRAVQETSPTFHLLELLRRIPAAFLREDNPVGAGPAATSQYASVTSLRDQIFALPSADSLAFLSTHTRCQYEALRLTALVYSHALASKIPFSSSAAQLCRVYNSTTATCNLSSDHLHDPDIGSLSWHILIKTALIRTNLSDCWGHMAGVLFFITLIAGACANPDSDANKSRRELSVEEEEEGRKWLAAITVRCSIVLSFEFGEVVLETLKRLVGIERVLGEGGSSQSSSRYDGDAGIKVHGGCYGPAEVPLAQHTFADYAQDFMAG